tara:strand:+ start:2536 stop:2853 length:318 start_codon:yes stop_codon:yes gene_type:complete
MNIIKKMKNLCTPAQLYLGLSFLSILAILTQNLENPFEYTCGLYTVACPIHNSVVFLMKLLYVIGWTAILHFLCKKGYTNVSWFLVLLPFISMFAMIAFVMFLLL